MPTLSGIHHLTAITADAPANLRFYTETLGMRLVKKTVNQDDTSAYHLFYGDGNASPGSDLTFFDFPAPPARRGTRSITRTGLRVAGQATLSWWRERLAAETVPVSDIAERCGRLSLDFEDFEGQRLRLVDDGGEGVAHPWEKSPIPAEHQIRGLGPITISVAEREASERVLTELLGMRLVREHAASEGSGPVRVFAMGEGGAGAELHVAHEPELGRPGPGAGSVHHVAFRVPDVEALHEWTARLSEHQMRSSGEIERYYFRSLYFREPSGILFELATDGPGFAVDEPLDQLGERLSLPPFLESERAAIEAGLKPL